MTDVWTEERELGKYDNSHNWLPRFISSWFYIWSNCVVCWYSVGNRHEQYVSLAFINIFISRQENLVENCSNQLSDLCILFSNLASFHLYIQKANQSSQFRAFVSLDSLSSSSKDRHQTLPDYNTSLLTSFLGGQITLL